MAINPQSLRKHHPAEKSRLTAFSSKEGSSSPTTSSGKKDDCCYDVGFSDKTYGAALDKAIAKMDRVL